MSEFKNDEVTITLDTLNKICNLLGGKLVDNIRLADICVLNKFEKEYFPPHVKLVNQEFIIDSFAFFKLPDFNNKKYSPAIKKKK